MAGELSYQGSSDGCSSKNSNDNQEEIGQWYMSRKEIEENSPSRKDGIDLKKETYFRKSYCTFLQELGMRLKVPQVTIATAIVFCHRFFLRQSHAKNDRRTIATVCMFLAGKVEETPRPLKDVILVSYEIIHKKDPAAAQRIKQKEVYEQQKELILLGERVVLATLGFDLNVQHPYKPLVEAIKKFKVAQNALAQVAWNFVNDGLRTSLCLQFKPHHIAAGAIFLAAKFLKVKLPSDGEKVWWQEFDVTPRQLEEVSNQMLELYEQNRVPQPQGSEVEGNAGGATPYRIPPKTPAASGEQASKQISAHPTPDHASVENREASRRGTENQSNDNGSMDMGSVITDQKADIEIKDIQHSEQISGRDMTQEIQNRSTEADWRNDSASCKSNCTVGQNLELYGSPVGQSPKEAIKKIDRDKVKAALEKRRKSSGEMTWKKDVMDEDDLIEKELEDGIELAADDEKNKADKAHSWFKNDNPCPEKDPEETRDTKYLCITGQSVKGMELENAEEGEMTDDASSMLNGHRKAGGLPT